jgi:hypothetical protein
MKAKWIPSRILMNLLEAGQEADQIVRQEKKEQEVVQEVDQEVDQEVEAEKETKEKLKENTKNHLYNHNLAMFWYIYSKKNININIYEVLSYFSNYFSISNFLEFIFSTRRFRKYKFRYS